MHGASPLTKPLLAIGCGPSNLSLLSLWAGAGQSDALIIDKQSSFSWHPGMQLPGAELQVSFLKDLVTLADPTNPMSFLAFVQAEGLLYRTIVASRSSVSRKMFERYYQWAVKKLGNIRFGTEVREVTLGQDAFHVTTDSEHYLANNVSVGVGKVPSTPDFDDPERDLYHSAHFTQHTNSNFSNQTIAVIGGGQSAAEIIEYLLNIPNPPREVHWICRRPMLLPLDDSPFVNEIYTPAFAEYFRKLPEDARSRLNDRLRMTSDGTSPRTLEALYTFFYRDAVEREDATRLRLKCSTEVTNVQRRMDGGCVVSWRDRLTDATDGFICDKIFYATGYRTEFPQFLEGIAPLLTLESSGEVRLDADFSAPLKTKTKARIFFQNASVGQFGLADQNLSLSAWRSAKIVNAVLGKEMYVMPNESLAVDFARNTAADEPWDGKVAV